MQTVNLQTSRSPTWTTKEIYVNVGLAFDAICGLVDVPVLETPKEYECADRGLRDRLHAFFAQMPSHWRVDDTESSGLGADIAQLAEALAPIDGPDAFRAHPWFAVGRPAIWGAQILYLTGDHAQARAEVEAVCAGFADRPPLNNPQHWIESAGLADLTA